MAHYLEEANGLINDGGGKRLLRSLHRQLKASFQSVSFFLISLFEILVFFSESVDKSRFFKFNFKPFSKLIALLIGKGEGGNYFELQFEAMILLLSILEWNFYFCL